MKRVLLEGRVLHLTRFLVVLVCSLMAAGPMTPVMAVQGDVRTNGTTTQPEYIEPGSEAAAGVPQNFFTGVGFLFEPESPYESLKAVPTWNEIEQLLDNPYAVVYDPNTPGNFDGWPSYRSAIVRRPGFQTPGSTLDNPGPALPQFLTHPLNYNPTDGEEMRLLNPFYPGGNFDVPYQLFQDLITDPTGNRWAWTYQTIDVSPGWERVSGPEIDYNGPLAPDPDMCVTNLELVPPESTQLCGHDPGEPNYSGFGVLNPIGYSTPAVPSVSSPGTVIPSNRRLFDPTRGVIFKRNGSGAGGLNKPSLRVPAVGGTNQKPNYLVNLDPNNVTPSNENDYYRPGGEREEGIPRGRQAAIVLGKSFFWDMQVGSDGVQSCGTCHFTGSGADTRTKNQINPNHLGGDLTINLHGSNTANQVLTAADFPFHKLVNPDIAGDPACTTPIVANVSAVTPALDHPVSGDFTVCDAANIVSDLNDVASSMGVRFGTFANIPTPGGGRNNSNAFIQLTGQTPRPLKADIRGSTTDPIPVFQGFRRVEPRNTPTMQAAGFNFDNFWDARARHDFNGGSVFGAADPQAHVWVNDGTENGFLYPTRQIIKFTSIASLATGPALSEFEMSFQGRNWQKIGKKLLQQGVVPLANQIVDPNDSVLGPYSGQRSSPGGPVDKPGRPGLNVSYKSLIQAAYRPQLWSNKNQHLNGGYSDGRTPAAPAPSIKVLGPSGTVENSTNDPFDGFVVFGPAGGAAAASDTFQFTQMEANFPLFWGLAVHAWVQILVPDNTPFDQMLEKNPDAFLSLGDTSEALLVDDLLNCVNPGQRNAMPRFACFTEFGNFKRDTNAIAYIDATAEGGGGATPVPSPGTRTPGSNEPDPLLGADIFFASNLSLKNRTFRSGRCGACHNMPTLTDHTMPFTFKAQLPDFASEFSPDNPGVELLTEPLGRSRVITGFLLESEIAENGQDAIERRFINQSIAPNPSNGFAYPDGVFNPPTYIGAGQAFIDNGVYNLGVRPIDNDIGRGGPDPFGWPLSLATLMMKNLGGVDFQPGNAMSTFDPELGPEGGLFEESAQDQGINPGGTDEPVNPLMPPHYAPFLNQISVGDSQPELDEPFAGINTLTDVTMLEGFVDVIGPVSPSAIKNEALNMGTTELMGTWPVPNRVLKDGAFKAPQLRNVELTGPYFHNGGLLTLRQVVDFYTRGGDFPITNAAHRDFLLTNLDIEAQSNLSEEEKVALVDFLLELTDERVRYARGPFDHPEVIVPIDGTAPDNSTGPAGLLAATCGTPPGPCFMDVPAVGTNGSATPQQPFLNLSNVRLSGDAANCGSAGAYSQYCH